MNALQDAELEALRAAISRMKIALWGSIGLGVALIVLAGVLLVSGKEVPQFVGIGIGSMLTGLSSIAALSVNPATASK